MSLPPKEKHPNLFIKGDYYLNRDCGECFFWVNIEYTGVYTLTAVFDQEDRFRKVGPIVFPTLEGELNGQQEKLCKQHIKEDKSGKYQSPLIWYIMNLMSEVTHYELRIRADNPEECDILFSKDPKGTPKQLKDALELITKLTFA